MKKKRVARISVILAAIFPMLLMGCSKQAKPLTEHLQEVIALKKAYIAKFNQATDGEQMATAIEEYMERILALVVQGKKIEDVKASQNVPKNVQQQFETVSNEFNKVFRQAMKKYYTHPRVMEASTKYKQKLADFEELDQE